MKKKIINRYTTGLLAIALIATAAAIFAFKDNSATAAQQPNYIETPQKTPGASEFSFASSSSTNGWWQGATDKVSMALFHKSNGCFVSIERDNGVITSESQLQKHLDSLTKQGYKVVNTGNKSLTLNTSSDGMKYQLYQYSVTGNNTSGKLLASEEFAYIPLPNSYLKIQGYCDTPDQLAGTIPALQAITFKRD